MTPVVGVGTDAVEIGRFAALLGRRHRLSARLFSPAELAQCAAGSPRRRAERLAARFAAKEAVMKALSVGLGATDFTDIEVRTAADGAPTVALGGRAERLAQDRGVVRLHVSLTHTATTAHAVVVAEGAGVGSEPGG